MSYIYVVNLHLLEVRSQLELKLNVDSSCHFIKIEPVIPRFQLLKRLVKHFSHELTSAVVLSVHLKQGLRLLPLNAAQDVRQRVLQLDVESVKLNTLHILDGKLLTLVDLFLDH